MSSETTKISQTDSVQIPRSTIKPKNDLNTNEKHFNRKPNTLWKNFVTQNKNDFFDNGKSIRQQLGSR